MAWLSGSSTPRSMTASAFGEAVGREAHATAAEHGLAGDVARPDGAGVDAATVEELLEVGPLEPGVRAR